MSEDVENGDLDVYLSYGFVLYGSFNDFVGIRKTIRSDFPKTKIVFPQIANEHLFLLKKSELTEEQIQKLEEKRKRK